MSSIAPSSRPSPLPWFAAGVALVAGSVLFLISVALGRLSSLSDGPRAMAYVSFAGGLVFRAGLAFLIAQWHGERHGRLACRRPLTLLALFALFLLCWQMLQGQLMATAFQWAGSATLKRALLVFSSVIYPVLHIIGTWLSWMGAAWILRKDAVPCPPAPMRLRTSGLIAWMPASVLLMLMPMGVSMFTVYGVDYALAATSYAGAIAAPVLVAFAGAWLGLPRRLARVHGWRLLGSGLGAMASAGYVLYRGFDLAAQAVPLLHTDVTVTTALFALASAVVGLGAFWLWTFALYAGLRTAANDDARMTR